MADFERVAAVADFEQGKLYNFKVNEKYVAVVRNGERFYAMLNSCTHAGYFLTPASINEDGQTIPCLAHGAEFRLEDGEATRGPADAPLILYEVRVEGDSVMVAPRSNS